MHRHVPRPTDLEQVADHKLHYGIDKSALGKPQRGPQRPFPLPPILMFAAWSPMVVADYRFSDAERFGVWSAYDGACFWCDEPVRFKDVTIDHILPESLHKDPEKLSEILHEYGLSAQFNLNDFQNWVPAHGKCNQTKSFDLFQPSPALIKTLAAVEKKAETARKTSAAIESDRAKERILGRLSSAVKAGSVSKAEVAALMEGIELEPPSPKHKHGLLISPEWAVVQTKDGVATVVRGHHVGITPVAADAHWSWDCPTCGNRGPWNGVICMSCGQRSYPD